MERGIVAGRFKRMSIEPNANATDSGLEAADVHEIEYPTTGEKRTAAPAMSAPHPSPKAMAILQVKTPTMKATAAVAMW